MPSMRVAVAFLCVTLVTAADLYAELEVEPTATTADIKAAYRRLALKFHPDKSAVDGDINGSFEERIARFIRVSEAYETLSNARKRARYDAGRKANFGTNAGRKGKFGANANQDFRFTFSLKDAFEVLEKFMGDLMPAALRSRYQVAKTALAAWPGYTTPLEELLKSGALGGALAAALKLVDWEGLGTAAKDTLQKAFEKSDGSVDWLKVAAAGAAGVTAVASALDASDDGNRTATLLSLGGQAASWLAKLAGSGGDDAQGKKEDL